MTSRPEQLKLMTIDPEIRNQFDELTKRAGYLWRYL